MSMYKAGKFNSQVEHQDSRRNSSVGFQDKNISMLESKETGSLII
jgi:hypothetical protein